MDIDHVLYSYLTPRVKKIKAGHCLLHTTNVISDEQYDCSTKYGGFFYLQMMNIYTQALHSFIPLLHSTWKNGRFLHIKLVDEDTRPIDFSTISNATLLYLLDELCSAVHLLHNSGVYHGHLHESSLFCTGDMRTIRLVGFADRDETCVFQDHRRADVRALQTLFGRISAVRRLDFSAFDIHFNEMSLLPVMCGLRRMAHIENNGLATDFMHSLQETLMRSVLTTHQVQYACVDGSSLQSVMESALGVFFAMHESPSMRAEPTLPIFKMTTGSPEQGASAGVPVVNLLFDYLVTEGYLVQYPGVHGFLASADLASGDDAKKHMVMMFAGYLIAYLFVMRIAPPCQLSSLLVNYVLQQGLAHTGINCGMSTQEAAAVLACRRGLIYMKTGAELLTSLPFFIQFPPYKLFAFFYDCSNNVTLPNLDRTSFDLSGLTATEADVFVRWLRMVPVNQHVPVTKLITNNTIVNRHSTRVVVTKGDCLQIATCFAAVTVPAKWLENIDELRQNMNIHINDTTFNTL